jgi:hypothetical protein
LYYNAPFLSDNFRATFQPIGIPEWYKLQFNCKKKALIFSMNAFLGKINNDVRSYCNSATSYLLASPVADC